MKKLCAIFLIAFLARFAGAALVSSNLFTLAAVNNATNAGQVVLLGYIQVPQTTFAVQNLGISNTNQLAVVIWAGFGSTTNQMAPIGVYTPSITNAQIDSFVLTNSGVIPIYGTVFVGTTTNLSVGVSAIQNH